MRQYIPKIISQTFVFYFFQLSLKDRSLFEVFWLSEQQPLFLVSQNLIAEQLEILTYSFKFWCQHSKMNFDIDNKENKSQQLLQINLEEMDKQNLIVLSLVVIMLCFAGPILTQFVSGHKDKPTSDSHDTIFIPRHNTTAFEEKKQLVNKAIDELLRSKGNDDQLINCQDLNKKLTWQLLMNFIKSSKRIQELTLFEEKWKTICVDWEQLKQNLEKEKQALLGKINLDKLTIQIKDEEIDRLSEQLAQATRPCPICPPSDGCGQIAKTQEELQSLLKQLQQNYNTTTSELATCKSRLSQEQAKGKGKAYCQQLHQTASIILKKRIEELKKLVNEELPLDKQKMIASINAAEQYLANPTNAELLIKDVDSIGSELVSGLQQCASIAERRRIFAQKCFEKYKQSEQQLLICQQKIKPFLKK